MLPALSSSGTTSNASCLSNSLDEILNTWKAHQRNQNVQDAELNKIEELILDARDKMVQDQSKSFLIESEDDKPIKITAFPEIFGCSEFLNIEHIKLKNFIKVTQLPETIKELKHIKTLQFYHCGLEQISSDIINNNPLLEELDVHNNRIKSFPAEIILLQSIRKIDFSKNRLTEIPDNIGNLNNSSTSASQIKTLKINSNRIEFLPYSITNLTRWNIIYSTNPLCSNRLDPAIISTNYVRRFDNHSATRFENINHEISRFGNLFNWTGIDLAQRFVSHVNQQIMLTRILNHIDENNARLQRQNTL